MLKGCLLSGAEAGAEGIAAAGCRVAPCQVMLVDLVHAGEASLAFVLGKKVFFLDRLEGRRLLKLQLSRNAPGVHAVLARCVTGRLAEEYSTIRPGVQ